VEHPPIDPGTQIEAAAPQLRTLDTMLADMRNTPPAPQGQQTVIPIGPTIPLSKPPR
jgi:hypothetical protein